MLTDHTNFLANYTNAEAKLGFGAFGTVHLWTCNRTREQRAIKSQILRDHRDVQDWQREESALYKAEGSKNPDARHIVRIYASCLTEAPSGTGRHIPSADPQRTAPPQSRMGYLVMEFCGLTLSDALHQRPNTPLPECLQWACHLFRGLTFIHSHGIIHRDLKPSNILLICNGAGGRDLKIADFGLSRERAEMMTAAVVTIPYRAPEILFGALTVQAGPPKCMQHSSRTPAHTPSILHVACHVSSACGHCCPTHLPSCTALSNTPSSNQPH